MKERGIEMASVIRIVEKAQPIFYRHRGHIHKGFYDSESSIFVSTSKDLIITVISGVDASYVSSLRERT